MKPKIVIGVPIMNQKEITQRFLNQLRAHQDDKKSIPIIFVDNGSSEPLRDWLLGIRKKDIVIRNEENVGVLPALNQIFKVADDVYKPDFIFYTHNDVMFYENGWDTKLRRILGEVQNVGVAGFYGAKGIGTPDIYRSPYVMQQMVRTENVSNCNRMNAAVHGFRPIRDIQAGWEEVAVMDGFSLIVNMELLRKTNGFDRKYPQHHMYDNDICMESLDREYRNIVIGMDVQHVGGVTDVGEDWAKNFGKTKQEIHQDAHPVFYDKWSPKMVESGVHRICLPYRVQ